MESLKLFAFEYELIGVYLSFLSKKITCETKFNDNDPNNLTSLRFGIALNIFPAYSPERQSKPSLHCKSSNLSFKSFSKFLFFTQKNYRVILKQKMTPPNIFQFLFLRFSSDNIDDFDFFRPAFL